jgi:NADH-quinone oxidoreductase subunit L
VTADPASWAALAPFFALLGAVVNGLFGRRLREPWPGIVATAAVAIAFALSLLAFVTFGRRDVGISVRLWDFVPVAGLDLAVGFGLDQLSLLMMLMVTGVGTLIHLYSLGYMHGDDGYARYFSALNLFVAAMLVLVMADSYLLMFVGWEGVGVCSFLLIGFWYRHKRNPDAARKAFIVNRIGDTGFLLALFLMYRTFGTLDIAQVNAAAGTSAFGAGALTGIGVLLMLAAAGKSAQLPLHVWLPDAMAGPTPVSALIHAATMVTAGVYLVARSAPLFAQSPDASAVVAWVGGLTALFAALVALAQTDIKRILAYSTISQLGFMFVAVGVGAYWVGIFHVLTHASFKGLLFLAAGSVIHGLGGEQDVRRMGGLRRYMPTTAMTALVGTLAIAGVPLLAGFFSKDAILLHTIASTLLADRGAPLLYGVLLLAAALTALYMGRWYLVVFEGEPRLTVEARGRIHESPRVMTVPLIVLAAATVVVGYIGLPAFAFPNWIAPYLEPVTGIAPFDYPPLWAEWLLIGVAVLASLIGLLGAWWLYGVQRGVPIARLGSGRLAAFVRTGAGIDALYRNAAVGPSEGASAALAVLDRDVLDRGLAAGVTTTGWLARGITLLQTGFARDYLLTMLIGAVALVFVVLLAAVRS